MALKSLSHIQLERVQQLTMMSTRLASPLRVLFSPKAFTRVVMFFLGSGRLMARMAGLWGFLRYLLISCNTKQGVMAGTASQVTTMSFQFFLWYAQV